MTEKTEPNTPSTNPKTLIGIKKVSLSTVPPAGLIHVARAMSNGVEKYGLMNYRESPVEARIYIDAAYRHLMAWADGEEVAEDSGVHHLGHVMACMAIILDAESTGMLVDDRPKKGKASELLEKFRDKY